MNFIQTLKTKSMRYNNLTVSLMFLICSFLILIVPLAESKDYVMGPEDEIEIAVWFHDELSKKLTIRSDGMITFPLVGNLKAAGLTTVQLAEKVGNGLSKYLVDPKVSVLVTKANSRKFAILGQVNSPGQYIIKSEAYLLDLISLAGGMTPSAKLSQSILLRGRNKIIKLDLRGLLFQGDLKDNIPLQPGDTLIIPENLENQFYVLGEVNKPGKYSLKESEKMTLRKAFGNAGGLKEYTVLKTASILKSDNKSVEVDLYKLFILNDQNQDLPIAPGDTIFVPKVVDNEFFVLGEVKKPGIYKLEGEVTALEGISMAGGYTADAVLKNTKIIRGPINNPEIMSVDLETAVTKAEMKGNISLQAGDILFVPESTAADVKYVLDKVLNPLQLIANSIELIYFATKLGG